MDQRAKLIARMVMLIVHGLQTKSYDDFVKSFSNPGDEPDAIDRRRRELCFQMRVSPTCWYNARADFSSTEIMPSASIFGDGDDFGVAISASAETPEQITVELYVPSGQRAGRDARAMVAALTAMPGWTNFAGIEPDLGLTFRF